MTKSIALLAILLMSSAATSVARAAVAVPAIGCPTDGQQGPQAVPKNGTKSLKLDAAAAVGLAFYRNADTGVLGPKGWHCLVLSGSSGTTILVTPEQIDAKAVLGGKFPGFSGDAIQLTVSLGETSGRFEAAKFIARLFPQDRVFVDKVIAEKFEPASHFVFGPYPTDRLTRKSEAMVEYETPANMKGLGTDSRLVPNASPISGMIFLGAEHSL